MTPDQPCPCKSGKPYRECCEPYHKGELPQTTEALMRSRFSAYSMGNADYIIATTHPLHKEFNEDRNVRIQKILAFSKNTTFKDLIISETINGDLEGFVTFKAILFRGDRETSFIEKSRFLKEQGRWLYVDGIFL